MIRILRKEGLESWPVATKIANHSAVGRRIFVESGERLIVKTKVRFIYHFACPFIREATAIRFCSEPRYNLARSWSV